MSVCVCAHAAASSAAGRHLYAGAGVVGDVVGEDDAAAAGGSEDAAVAAAGDDAALNHRVRAFAQSHPGPNAPHDCRRRSRRRRRRRENDPGREIALCCRQGLGEGDETGLAFCDGRGGGGRGGSSSHVPLCSYPGGGIDGCLRLWQPARLRL